MNWSGGRFYEPTSGEYGRELTLQPPRYNIDSWESMMMERDRRLTGSHRGQSVGLSFRKSRFGSWLVQIVEIYQIRECRD
jgi:hypothetical protein